jgi:hypothetical protein
MASRPTFLFAFAFQSVSYQVNVDYSQIMETIGIFSIFEVFRASGCSMLFYEVLFALKSARLERTQGLMSHFLLKRIGRLCVVFPSMGSCYTVIRRRTNSCCVKIIYY